MTPGFPAYVYLSRLVLNPESPQVRSELVEPYEMHRTLMRAFPETGEKARERFGVLFRAEAEEARGRPFVLVQSLYEPDWHFLGAVPGYLDVESVVRNPESKDIARALLQLRTGQVLRFRLRANPTKRVARDEKTGGAMNGKRVGLVREEAQLEWLNRKGQSGGFELVRKSRVIRGEQVQIPAVQVTVEGKQGGCKKCGEEQQRMTHLAVLFDGLLRITDADIFRQTIIQGIGPAKAFGFGLLSIAPARV